VLGPVLGEATPTGGALSRDGELVAETDDPAALTGGHEAMVRVVEETIGRKLEPGEVVITGSIVPPTPIAAGQRWQGEVQGLGALAVTLSTG
jgi:2-keto-4-pentenoate hydratase